MTVFANDAREVLVAGGVDAVQCADGPEEPRPTTRAIVRDVFKIAAPAMMTYVLDLVNELTNTVILGHSGKPAALAAVGLGNMMQNCVGLSVGFGICGALDTLVSQAFGAGRHHATVGYLQRCRVLVALQLLWMAPLLWFSGSILAYIHEDAEVARSAGAYNRASVWGLFAIFQFEAGMKFLANRQETLPPLAISVITSILHIGWCSLFVLHFDLGNEGAGYANAVTWWIRFALMTIYLACSAPRLGLSRRSLLWLEADAWRDWREFGRYAIPSTVQLATEWWFWEICALVVGYLGKTALAAHVSALNFLALSFMPVIGLQSATATLAGNALGANLPRKTRKTIVVCLWTNVSMWSCFAVVIVLCRDWLAMLYTTDSTIRGIVEKLLCIFAVAGLGDSSQNIMSGALRGVGLTSFASCTYVVSYYAVMLPIGIVLAFPLHVGVYGVWYSFFIGTLLAAAIFAMRLWRLDFRELALDANRRMEAEEQAELEAKAAAAAQAGGEAAEPEARAPGDC